MAARRQANFGLIRTAALLPSRALVPLAVESSPLFELLLWDAFLYAACTLRPRGTNEQVTHARSD
jgi:hypothetical protein